MNRSRIPFISLIGNSFYEMPAHIPVPQAITRLAHSYINQFTLKNLKISFLILIK